MKKKFIKPLWTFIIVLVIDLCQSSIKVNDLNAKGQCMFLLSDSSIINFHYLKATENK